MELQHSGLQAQGLALVYPCLTTAFDTPSAQKHAHAPLLTTEDMHFYLKEYAPNSQDWQDLRLALYWRRIFQICLQVLWLLQNMTL